MATIHPFKAVRPTPAQVAQVATPPYDVMSRKEAAAMAAGKPLSFLHVTRSEIDLPELADAYDQRVYQQARDNYRQLRQAGVLVQEEQPAYYVYRLTMGGRSQTGLVATAAIDDYDREIIKKHEKTRQAKEDDRTRHILATKAQTGPVFLAYRDSQTVDQLVAATMTAAPLFDFVADDGVGHTVWTVPSRSTAPLTAAFAEIPALYIADGHHRAASASRVRASRRHDNPNHTGQEPYNRFLAVLFPAGQLQILPYNRVVVDLNGRSPDAFAEALRGVAEVADQAPPIPTRPGTCSVYLAGRWRGLAFRVDPSRLSVIDRLDVSILQNQVLAPLLGIDDPRTSDRIDFVGGIRGTGELEQRVDSGTAAVAFSMYPTTLEQLMAIADAGQIMPPKSTWFEPKLRDAMLIHQID